MNMGILNIDRPQEVSKKGPGKLTYTAIALGLVGGIAYLVFAQPGCNVSRDEDSSRKFSYPTQIEDRS